MTELKFKDIYELEPIPIEKWRNHISHLVKEEELIQQLLLPGQIMIIAGRAGIGKTNELLHLCYCFSYGVKWHGLEIFPCTSPVKSIPVLLEKPNFSTYFLKSSLPNVC